jgi:hypothetical protein
MSIDDGAPGAHDAPEVPGYDPERAPDPAAWLALGEWDRMALIDQWHQNVADGGPGRHAHAVMHCIVENQLAAGEPAAALEALHRLRAEGLSRHDAVHAIGSVAAQSLHDVIRSGGEARNPGAAYESALRRLTAASWRALGRT